jgi:hypothetical protein
MTAAAAGTAYETDVAATIDATMALLTSAETTLAGEPVDVNVVVTATDVPRGEGWLGLRVQAAEDLIAGG